MIIGVEEFHDDIAVTVNKVSHAVWILRGGLILVPTAYPQEGVDYQQGTCKIIGIDLL